MLSGDLATKTSVSKPKQYFLHTCLFRFQPFSSNNTTMLIAEIVRTEYRMWRPFCTVSKSCIDVMCIWLCIWFPYDWDNRLVLIRSCLCSTVHHLINYLKYRLLVICFRIILLFMSTGCHTGVLIVTYSVNSTGSQHRQDVRLLTTAYTVPHLKIRIQLTQLCYVGRNN